MTVVLGSEEKDGGERKVKKNVFPIPDDQSLCIPGIPTVCDVALALYSKLLPDRVQGAGQVTTADILVFLYL